MYTRCPECATTFRLTPAQLRVAHGKVRCGNCSTVFDAVSHLVEDDEARDAGVTGAGGTETRARDSSLAPGPETPAAVGGGAADKVAEEPARPPAAGDAATDTETASERGACPQTQPADENAAPPAAGSTRPGAVDTRAYYDFTEPTGGFEVTELAGDEALWFDSAEALAENHDEPDTPGARAELTGPTDELVVADSTDDFEVTELPGEEALWFESTEAGAENREEARILASSVEVTELTDELEVTELTDELEVTELADELEVSALTGEEDLWFDTGEDIRGEYRAPGASEADTESSDEPPTAAAGAPAPQHPHPQPEEDSASSLPPSTGGAAETADSTLPHTGPSADGERVELASDIEITELPADGALWTEPDTLLPPASEEQEAPPPGERARDPGFPPAAEEAASRAAPETESSDFEVMELPAATRLPDDHDAAASAILGGAHTLPTETDASASGLTILSGLEDTGSAYLELTAEEHDAEDVFRDTRDLDEELLESSGILEAPRYPASPAAPSNVRGTEETDGEVPPGPDAAARSESTEFEADAQESEDPWDGLFFDDDHGIPDLAGITPARKVAAAGGAPEPATPQPLADEPDQSDGQQGDAPGAVAEPAEREERSAAPRGALQPSALEPGPPAEAGPASGQETRPGGTGGLEAVPPVPPARDAREGDAATPASATFEPQTDIPEHILAALRAARAIDARKPRSPARGDQAGAGPATPDAGAKPHGRTVTAGKAAEQPGPDEIRDVRSPHSRLLEDILRENASQEPVAAETPVRTPAKPTTGMPDTVDVDESAWDELAAQLGLGDTDRPDAGPEVRVAASADATPAAAQPVSRAVAAPDESSAVLAELEDALKEAKAVTDDAATALPQPARAEIVSPPLTTGPPRRRRWLTIASFVLALLLALQIIHANRLALVDHPVLGTALRGIYGGVGRDLPADWELSSYDLRQLGGAVSPDDPATIIIRVSLRNAAKRPQPYPRIRLHLEDRWGERVGQRDLLPSEYAAVGPDQMLAPGQHILADIAVQDPPGVEATNFQIDACLELLPGRLSCANENAN